MKKKTYRKFTPQEIATLKRKRIEKEAKREEIENNSLIQLRRKYLITSNEEVQFKKKIISFNNYVSKKKPEEIAKVVSYWLSNF